MEIDRESKVHVEGDFIFINIYKGYVVGQGILL